MITRYDTLYEKNDVVLIVNLDFYYEFADFNAKEYTKDLKKEIKKIAKKHHANKVKIMIGGVLISTLLLTPQHLDNDYNKTNFITNNTIKDSFNEVSLEDNDENSEEIIIIDESKPKDKVKSETSNNIQNTTSNKTQTITPTTNNNSTINKNDTSTNENTKIETSINQTKKTNDKEENKKQETIEEIDNNTYVTINRSNGSIIKLELEEYLIGVVGSEMPASFNIEALKAQAVVARTYTLKRISQNKILTDTTSTQVYKDNDELKSMWGNDFDKYYNKVKNAVMSTKGMVLIYNNNYIDAVYHSTSNGMTEDAIYVWGYDIPYLKSVESKTDTNASSYKRETTFTLEKLSSLLNTTITKDTNFILERNSSGRVSNVKVNDIEIQGTIFRNLLSLRSTDFTIELSEDSAKITTYGYGHGVGMSQYGANGMANLGYNFKNILNHYYQNVVIKNI